MRTETSEMQKVMQENVADTWVSSLGNLKAIN